MKSGKPSTEPDQGVFQFDARSAIHIQMKLFQMEAKKPQTPTTKSVSQLNSAAGSNASSNDTLIATVDADEAKIGLQKTYLQQFFILYDNAVISATTKTTSKTKLTLSTFKQSGRFYVFSCESVDLDGEQKIVANSRGILLTFENLEQLQTFLMINFGSGGKQLQDCIEMRSLEIDFVPIECLNNKAEAGNAQSINSDPTLRGELCQCSVDVQGHIEKVTKRTLI